MCWHLRPVRLGHNIHTPPRVNLNTSFTRCIKIFGYNNKANNSSLCSRCYSKIRTTIIKAQFEPVQTHYLFVGSTLRYIHCSNCYQSMTVTRSLHNCGSCNNEHLELLTEIAEEGESLDDYEDPIVIHITGQYY